MHVIPHDDIATDRPAMPLQRASPFFPPDRSHSRRCQYWPMQRRAGRRMIAFIMNLLAMLSNLGGPDLIIILLIVLVLFGAKKLPELAKGMGSAIKEFQKAKDDFTDEL